MSTTNRDGSKRFRNEIEDGAYHVTHDDSRDSLSTTVVLALCEVADVDPSDFQLYRHVDPDALDALFVPAKDVGGERGHVELIVLDYRVTIHGSGEIVIRPFESEASTDPEAE